MNAEKKNNKEYLISKEKDTKVTPLVGTPFNMVEVNGEIILVIGNEIVSEKRYKNEKEVKDEIGKLDWGLIINTVLIISNRLRNEEKIKAKTKKN